MRQVADPSVSTCLARKPKLSTSHHIMPTRYATNLISKLPKRGFNSLPTQKSRPNEPWVCLSTYYPKKDLPRVPFKYSRVLTIRAKMLTSDQRGQNCSAKIATLKSGIWLNWVKTPPQSSRNKIVIQVSLNPLMEYLRAGPLLGL